MNLPSRKRAARSSSPPSPPSTSRIRENQGDSDIDALTLIPAADAWPFEISELLSLPSDAVGGSPEMGDNRGNYVEGESVFVLCVMGGMGMRVHYDLLCIAYPTLLTLSPRIQILALTPTSSLPTPLHPTFTSTQFPRIPSHDPTQNTPLTPYQNNPDPPIPIDPSSPTLLALPLLPTPPNLLLTLGLLHPLGGGTGALDAIVLLDAGGRRRLVVPFGWGAGRHIFDAAGGGMLRRLLMGKVVEGVGGLVGGN
ncbi:hypothetical protein M501DRAFT_1053712 [Patellaria atrata CBS 101060]|uniref:Uncharacterized protein n=1 Tax=Patellaria atrata CBS 101060 TaxID=1346257 RepID=A0A9P4VRG7_9PEZI|nr:hypothetical protein M501DRAFT_1053712 [Patellaria atrata CBS 101060]